MAYSEKIAERIRRALSHLPKVEEKKMFGHLAFMVNNKMCITAGPDRIMCRVDPAIHEELVKTPGVSPVLMRGREYKGYVHVEEDSIESQKDFDYWVALVIDYNKRARSSKSKR